MKREQLLEAVEKVEREGLLPAGQGAKVGSRLAELLFPPRDFARSAAAVVAWLGGILIAAGILSFVAANWETIGKTPKLALIFGTLAGLHFVGWRFAVEPGRHPALGHALIAAAMLSFGAAIGLVAQIYNLSSHYPRAILAWWLLTLPFPLLLQSRKLLLIPLALFLLWVHWHASVWIDDHRPSRGWWRDSELLAFGYLELGLGALLAAAAAGCRHVRFEGFAAPLAAIARLAVLAGLFILSFEDVGSGRLVNPEEGRRFEAARMHDLGILLGPAGCLAGAALLLGALVGVRRGARSGAAGAEQAPRRDLHELTDGGAALLAAIAAAATLLLLPPAAFLAANGLLLGAVVALVMRGTARQRPADVNLAVVAFLVTVMARYFEYVAKGAEPVLAFLGGGVLLLVLGAFLERKRRTWVLRAAGRAS